MTLCKFSFDDYYREVEAVNDNKCILTPVWIGWDLVGWKVLK